MLPALVGDDQGASACILSSSITLPLESFHLLTRRHKASLVEKVPALVEAVQVGCAFLPVQLRLLVPRGHFTISSEGKKRLLMKCFQCLSGLSSRLRFSSCPAPPPSPSRSLHHFIRRRKSAFI